MGTQIFVNGSTRALTAFLGGQMNKRGEEVHGLVPARATFLVDGLLQVAFALWLQHFGTLVGRTHRVLDSVELLTPLPRGRGDLNFARDGSY